MKTILTSLMMLMILQPSLTQTFYASGENLRSMEGHSVQIDEIFISAEGTILVFWETNDAQCNSNLENLNESWIEKVKPFGVNLVSVCIDKSGNWLAVKPYVEGKGWEFDTYIDINGKLKRAFGITSTPYTILLDGNGNIKCRYPGYCSGDETRICDKIIHCMENSGTLADL